MDRPMEQDYTGSFEDASGLEQAGAAEHEGQQRPRRAVDRAREKLEGAKHGLAAGASGLAERTRTVANEAAERAGRAVQFVREAEPDEQLRSTVSERTQRSLDRAGNAVTGAAPTVGRGAEKAVELVGAALHSLARPLATVLGAIAGTLGGWWKKASSDEFELPAAEEAACRAHFTSITVLPAGMDYEQARTGYALGWVASRNPEYRGRGFDEVEPELRRGFGEEHADAYDSLREFTRYGYGRGSGSGFEQES